MLKRKLMPVKNFMILFVLLAACGESPGPYIPSNGTTSSATSEGTGTKGQGAPVQGTKVTNPTPGSAPAKSGAGTTTPAAGAPQTPAGSAPSAALIQQGTTVYNAKCASCHGALAQKAADPRINARSAAFITAAKTSKPLPHGPVVWPSAAEVSALEAALK